MIRNSSTPQARWDLRDIATEYADNLRESQGYIGYQVLLPYGSDKKSGQALRVPKESILKKNTLRPRAPGTGYQQASADLEQFTFNCLNYGIEFAVDDEIQSNYNDAMDAMDFAAKHCVRTIMDDAELRIANLLTNGTTWTGGSLTTAISTAWTTWATAVPITDVEGAIAKVYANSGMSADTVVMSWKAFRNARQCDQVLDRIKYQGNVDARAENISPSALAAAFGVARVLVSGMPKNTADEGQTPAISSIWGNGNVMVCKTARDIMSLLEPCVGRSIIWREAPATHQATNSPAGIGGDVRIYRDESRSSDVVRVNHYPDEQVFDTACGHLLTGAAA